MLWHTHRKVHKYRYGFSVWETWLVKPLQIVCKSFFVGPSISLLWVLQVSLKEDGEARIWWKFVLTCFNPPVQTLSKLSYKLLFSFYHSRLQQNQFRIFFHKFSGVVAWMLDFTTSFCRTFLELNSGSLGHHARSQLLQDSLHTSGNVAEEHMTKWDEVRCQNLSGSLKDRCI